jgi:hypothetical protein
LILSRRRLLTFAGGIPTSQVVSAFIRTASAHQTATPALQEDPAMVRRIARVIQEYDDQGDHRTGTDIGFVVADSGSLRRYTWVSRTLPSPGSRR